jgi:hypothetical protein
MTRPIKEPFFHTPFITEVMFFFFFGFLIVLSGYFKGGYTQGNVLDD